MQKHALNMHNFVKTPKSKTAYAALPQAQHPADRQRKGEGMVLCLLRYGGADGLHHGLTDAAGDHNEHQLFFRLNGKAKQLLSRFAGTLRHQRGCAQPHHTRQGRTLPAAGGNGYGTGTAA